ncbi:MAG: hypothetical protein JWM73_465 [Solirubrobacterales bacterium]|jgi:hypothetical protein|nr:hypothetical protein [Solirubrobacterales bacterium]
MGFETAIGQWREGERRLTEASGDELRILLRVSEQIYLELRRRLGSTFLVDELVALYEDGTDWAQQVAMGTAPDHPFAWDPRTVTDGAFARYLREAADYAGGRRLTPDG